MYTINESFSLLRKIEILFKNIVMNKIENNERLTYQFSFVGENIEGEKGIYKFRFGWDYKPEELYGFDEDLDAYCLRIDILPPYGNIVHCVEFNRGSNNRFDTYEHFTPATIDITGKSLENLSIYNRGTFQGDETMDDTQLVLSNDKGVCNNIISWRERLEVTYKSLSAVIKDV